MSLSIREISLCRFCSAREGLRAGSAKACSLCNGLFDRSEQIAEEITEKLREYQYDSFLIGTTMSSEVIDKEDELRARLRIRGKESIKSQFNNILTQKITLMTKKKVNYSMPDITVLLSLTTGSISLTSRSVWLSAHYKKRKRGVSQRSSTCQVCNGLGCAECSYKGRSGKSVESLASSLFAEKFRAESCNFVWLGSEDENSLVEGAGRPFFVEVIQPRRRFAGLTISKSRKLELASDGVEIIKLHRLERKFSDVPLFDISCKVFLNSETGSNIPELQSKEIEEKFSNCFVGVRLNRKYRTVQRLVRTIKARTHSDGSAELMINCEGGIPIKKLVTGQDNTVEPNLSQFIKLYHIDPERPFDILDVKLRKPGLRPTESLENFTRPATDPT